MGGTLDVTNATTLNNTLTVKENAIFDKDLTIGSNLNVAGQTTLNSNLILNDTLKVTNATTLENKVSFNIKLLFKVV